MRFVTYNHIKEIKKDWCNLYCSNATLSPYQSYEWNANLFRRIHFLRTELLNNSYHFISYYRTDQQQATVIIPLVIPKSEQNIFIFGDYLKSGALNFIYSSDVNENDFFAIFNFLKKQYPKRTFRLFEIPDFSALGQFLYRHRDSFELFFERESVRSFLPTTVEELNQNLSKSVRQTIRTSYNRLKRDGLNAKIEINYSYRFSIKESAYCARLSNIRKKEWGYK
jgi:hypothetical protein